MEKKKDLEKQVTMGVIKGIFFVIAVILIILFFIGAYCRGYGC